MTNRKAVERRMSTLGAMWLTAALLIAGHTVDRFEGDLSRDR